MTSPQRNEWARYLIGLLLAGLVAYFTALNTVQRDLATVKAMQESQFGEVLRRLELLQADIRELRSRP